MFSSFSEESEELAVFLNNIPMAHKYLQLHGHSMLNILKRIKTDRIVTTGIICNALNRGLGSPKHLKN